MHHMPTNGELFTNGEGDELFSSSKSSLFLILANTLDYQSLSGLFSSHPGFDRVDGSSDVDFGFTLCRRLNPKILVIDPKISGDSIDRAAEAKQQGFASHVVILDDRVHEGRLNSVLQLPAFSYITRQTKFEVLANLLTVIAYRGERVFDHSVSNRVVSTPHGLKLHQTEEQPSISELTSREMQVMKLLAVGHSVRDCAEKMKLAISTIDNHKSRMMKKLNIHKATEVTHVAIREGVIHVEEPHSKRNGKADKATNGAVNGPVNGAINGSTNGTANGMTNGSTNGHA